MGIEIRKIHTLLQEQGTYSVKICDVYIENDRIAGIDEKPSGFIANNIIQGEGKFLIPGLINTHTHSYMSIFRNCADDLPFDAWLFQRILPLEDQLTEQDGYWGAMLSCIEMIRTGTTCFLDMHMFKHQTVRAVNACGMRAVISRGLVGNGEDEGGQRRLDEALEEIDEYNTSANDGRVTFMLAPHAIYTCDEQYLQKIVAAAKASGMGIHTHLSESVREVEESIKNYGITPIAFCERAGVFEVPTLAAHCVHLDIEDIEILAKHKVNVATNPISNMKLGNGIAPVQHLLQKGVNVSIGTDSSASNNALNLFRELSAVSLIHKAVSMDPTAVSAADAINLATVNGAKSLGLPEEIGAVKQGMKADLVILDIEMPQFYPRNNLVSALIYSANGSEVETVIINGSIVMEDRKLCLVDEQQVYSEIEKIRERLSI